MGRRWVTVAIVVIGTAALVALALAKASGHRLEVKTYLADAQGLQRGAPVHMAGVEIGTVNSVRVRPELRDKPAEVVMQLRTSYELNIPKDAVASVQTAGMLGQTFVDINIKNSSGSPLENGATITSTEASSNITADVVEKLQKTIQNLPCNQHPGETQGSSGKKP